MHWYYLENGSKQGPFDKTAFENLIKGKIINAETSIFSPESMTNWIPASKSEFHVFFSEDFEQPSAQVSDNPADSLIVIGCPECGQRLRLPAVQGTIRVTCTSCRKVFTHAVTSQPKLKPEETNTTTNIPDKERGCGVVIFLALFTLFVYTVCMNYSTLEWYKVLGLLFAACCSLGYVITLIVDPTFEKGNQIAWKLGFALRSAFIGKKANDQLSSSPITADTDVSTAQASSIWNLNPFKSIGSRHAAIYAISWNVWVCWLSAAFWFYVSMMTAQYGGENLLAYVFIYAACAIFLKWKHSRIAASVLFVWSMLVLIMQFGGAANDQYSANPRIIIEEILRGLLTFRAVQATFKLHGIYASVPASR